MNTENNKDVTKYVGAKIKEFRKAKKMTQKELGEAVGDLKHNTISSYESGTNEADQDVLFKIANILDVSINDLFPPTEDVEEQPTNLIPLAPATVKIPVLGYIACGEPILAEENFSGFRYESPDNLPSGKLIYLEAKGDSMEPTIPNGSFVLIREQPEVEYGEIAAVLVNGDTEATLKRVKRQGDTVILMPDNPNHEPYIITPNNPARIIGKAVRYTQDL